MPEELTSEAICWLMQEGYAEYRAAGKMDELFTQLRLALVQTTATTIHLLKEGLGILLSILHEKPHDTHDTTLQETFGGEVLSALEQSGDYNEEQLLDYRYIDAAIRRQADGSKLQQFYLGSVLASVCSSELRHTFSFQPAPVVNTSELQRLKYILGFLAKKCTYERTGDVYIHTLLRSKLYAYRQALLCDNQTPYDNIAEQYVRQANDLVRPFIDTDPDVKFEQVQWNNAGDLDGFHFLAGVLREALDGVHCPLYVNTAIVRAPLLSGDQPYLFCISAHFHVPGGLMFGYGVGRQLFYAPPETLSHLLVLHHFIFAARTSECPPALADLCQACVDPGNLSSSSPLHTLAEELLKC